ncbi:MAG: zinc-binding dehydrogenase [Candidatus Brockarchaeota archaeon]|nr:zinc-binding dehydrogenase [Candidatus Brockarchaeota archaeon]MBO3808795.1 zinc-binding dehydrogenase [Candidatus Brockarchaeota archaeon]
MPRKPQCPTPRLNARARPKRWHARIYEILQELGYEEATLTEPVSCAIHRVEGAGIKLGENVVVIGGGPMGQIILQLAKRAGASKIIVVTRSQWKLELAERLEATHSVNSTSKDVPRVIKEITGGFGADAVIEAVGTPETFEEALVLGKRGGRIVVFGFSPEGVRAAIIPFEILSKELTIPVLG